MTCKDKLSVDHPEWTLDEFKDTMDDTCPSCHGYLKDPTPRGDWCDVSRCSECWEREMSQETKGVDNIRSTLDEVYQKYPKNFHVSIRDSGDRTKFSSGAVRDMRAGKGRCDLVPLMVASKMLDFENGDPILESINGFLIKKHTEFLYDALNTFTGAYHNQMEALLLEVAKHFEEGAKKYGESNWQKGIPIWCYIDSAVRHYLKWLRGDKDEPHDRAFVWNLMCCIWEVDYSGREHEEASNE